MLRKKPDFEIDPLDLERGGERAVEEFAHKNRRGCGLFSISRSNLHNKRVVLQTPYQQQLYWSKFGGEGAATATSAEQASPQQQCAEGGGGAVKKMRQFLKSSYLTPKKQSDSKRMRGHSPSAGGEATAAAQEAAPSSRPHLQ